MSDDGKYLIIGSPEASKVKTNYKNTYEPTQAYVAGDIVSYNNLLWKSTTSIVPESDSIQFTSFMW